MAKPAYYIEGIPLYKNLMDPSQSNFPAHPMKPEYITIHETENYDEGADAEMHSKYLLNEAWGRQASWQYTVDENSIHQHALNTQSCWAAGDGNGKGNRASINIELCENEGSDFKKTIANAQALVRRLMKDENISLSEIKPHNFWSGKRCPGNILAYWNDFIDGVSEKKDAKPVNVKPVPPKNNVNNSIVDYLASVNRPSDFKSRVSFAKEFGVKDYKGTALQNIELLRKMQKGGPSREVDQENEPASKPVSKPAPTKVSSYRGTSIVAYLESVNDDSSFKNRTRLATKYGISNYKGTAHQNLQLLQKLRMKAKENPSNVSSAKGDQNTGSIVDYLISIKQSASFANRSKLAKKHGINNYIGSAAQNTTLLNKVRK